MKTFEPAVAILNLFCATISVFVVYVLYDSGSSVFLGTYTNTHILLVFEGVCQTLTNSIVRLLYALILVHIVSVVSSIVEVKILRC
jgi:hypothetical protein